MRNTPNLEFVQRLRRLEQKTDYLKRIRKITNELKSNGAYSTKNMENEEKLLDSVHTEQWEKDILHDTWDIKKHIAKNLWDELKDLNALYRKTFMSKDADTNESDN